MSQKSYYMQELWGKALYWGDDSYKEDFNSDGVLNIRETSSMLKFLNGVTIRRKRNFIKVKMQEVQPGIFTKDPTKILNVNRLREGKHCLGWRKQ